MHLALAIKNTILFILIILIVHFMVKNVLLEKPQSKPVQPVPSGSASEPVSTVVISKKADADIPPSKPSSDEVPRTKQQGGLDKAKEELLKFVSDDDEDLDKFFTKCTTTKSTSSDNAICKSRATHPPFPLSTTCDPAIQKLPEATPQATLCAKKTTNTQESKKKVMILQEYDNENSMNGGDLYGGLKAYDMFDDNYQQYSCTV